MKIKTIFLLLFISPAILTAQCSGNLGENIFPEGDFGSGIINIPSQDPMIAPGYSYTTSPPPDDGSYVITNNTTNWGSFASLWADIGDNSPDPNGYMMVVNASYSPGLFYEREVSGLCENTQYVFSADIFNLIAGVQWIKPNVSFLLDGEVAIETGDIPDNNEWITYGFTFTTATGQTSLTLALANNAPGGNGNDLALDNITFRPCGPEALILPQTVANICEDGEPLFLEATINGDQYDNPALQWQQSFDGGQTWVNIAGATDFILVFDNLVGGDYYYRYLLANAESNLNNPRCRVVSNVKVVNVIPKYYSIIDTLCEGLSFNLNGIQYSQSGIYTDSLFTVLGCDSVVTLDLTIIDDTGLSADFTIDDPLCFGEANGSIIIDSIYNGSPPFATLINGQLAQSNLLANLSSGNYRYLIQDRYRCAIDTFIELNSPPPFLLDLGEDLLVELGQAVRIRATSNQAFDTITWMIQDDFDCFNNCQSVSVLPRRSQAATATVISEETACTAMDSVRINVINNRNVFIPNAFSPNNDGINDQFMVFATMPNVEAVLSMNIYDRWGGLIYNCEPFLPNGQNTGWDGTKNGIPLAIGSYLYDIKILFFDGKEIRYTGFVNLLR